MRSKNKRQKGLKLVPFIGSGNVFEDLERSDATEALAKAKLAYRIGQIIDSAGLTQMQAARRLGIDQPKVSALLHGRLAGFSIERLFRFLNDLGQDVEIRIRPSSRRQPALLIRAAG